MKTSIMKKAGSLFAGLFFMSISLQVNAQSSAGADYFAGKWCILVKDTPVGDAKMYFLLEKRDSTLTGSVQDSTGIEMSKIENVELADTTVNVFFNAMGNDVNILLSKKDDDHVTGSLMGMFDAVGDRVKK